MDRTLLEEAEFTSMVSTISKGISLPLLVGRYPWCKPKTKINPDIFVKLNRYLDGIGIKCVFGFLLNYPKPI